jgi:hypothetical protein
VNEGHTKHPFLGSVRKAKLRDEEGFVVRHFAGDVKYHTSQLVAKESQLNEVTWLEKNNDTMDIGWLQKLAHSNVELLSEMFKPDFEASKSRKVCPFPADLKLHAFPVVFLAALTACLLVELHRPSPLLASGFCPTSTRL